MPALHNEPMPSRVALPPGPDIGQLSPMLLSANRRPFDSADWLFELKLDGYRLLAQAADGRCSLRTRRGADATRWFPELVQGLSALPTGRHVLDGEVCVLDDIGRSDFNQLHERARRRAWYPGCPAVVFCAFDLLVESGRTTYSLPLEERKARLQQLLACKPASTLFVSAVPEQGKRLFEMAVALKLEGLVAKRSGSVYRPGERSTDWVKVKRPGAVSPQRFRRDDF